DATGPGGGPGVKKAETAEITPVTGWNTAPVLSPVVLMAGTYWLAYAPSDNNMHFRRAGNTGSIAYYARTYGPLPGTFSTSPTAAADHWSFYGTLNTATAAGSIAGKVTNQATGSAISGATVSYSGGSTTSVVDGSYALSNVTAGTYTVTCAASGFNTQ